MQGLKIDGEQMLRALDRLGAAGKDDLMRLLSLISFRRC